MTHYIIAMKDGWKPGDCYICQFKCEAKHGINPACPLVNAREAVEVTTWQGEPTHHGKHVKLYAVEIKEKN
jgi:hypothetical protein